MKGLKKLLAMVLSLMMVIGYMPAMTFADDTPVQSEIKEKNSEEQIGNEHSVTYNAWTDAEAASLYGAGSGKTASNSLPSSGDYCLIGDVTVTAATVIDSGDELNLYLNGRTITLEGDDCVFHIKGGTLNLDDNFGVYGKITGGQGCFYATCKEGGGVFVESGTFNMYGGIITGNNAYHGGGVAIASGGSFNMYGGIISNNRAEFLGGGVYNSGTFNMSDGTIEGNTSSFDGAGVGNFNTFNMSNGTITGNTATNAGGGIENSSTFNMSGGMIEGNTTKQAGGGIDNSSSGTFNMSDGTIEGNASGYGGGMFNTGSVEMNGGTIKGNTADDGGGVDSSGTFTMNNGTIEDNTVSGRGGGVTVADGTFTMEGGTIKNNTAADYTLEDYEHSNDGGGVYVEGGSFIMNDGTITGNNCHQYGGGISCMFKGNIILNGGLITQNSAKNGGGVYSYSTETTFTMNKGIIQENEAASNGGGVYLEGASFSMNGGSINNNIAKYDGGGVFDYVLYGSVFSVSGNPDITNNKTGTDGNYVTNNVYLHNGETITVADAMTEGTKIGVTMESGTGMFTSGWSTYMSTTEPDSFFSSDAAEKVVVLDNGEAAIEEKPEETAEWQFTDIKEEPGNWIYDAAKYVYDRGIMTGMRTDYFGVTEKLSRGQFATVLYRMSGADGEYKAVFPDVKENKWYGIPVSWAAETGVVTGYENGRFGPADDITREQLATMLYRYAEYMGYDVSEKADFSKYPDAWAVSDWAKDAMEWAVGSGIIKGQLNGIWLDPQGKASRAECATTIMRFMEKYVEG